MSCLFSRRWGIWPRMNLRNLCHVNWGQLTMIRRANESNWFGEMTLAHVGSLARRSRQQPAWSRSRAISGLLLHNANCMFTTFDSHIKLYYSSVYLWSHLIWVIMNSLEMTGIHMGYILLYFDHILWNQICLTIFVYNRIIFHQPVLNTSNIIYFYSNHSISSKQTY